MTDLTDSWNMLEILILFLPYWCCRQFSLHSPPSVCWSLQDLPMISPSSSKSQCCIYNTWCLSTKPKLDPIYLKALITSCSFCASSRAHLVSQSFKVKGINEWKVFCPETQIVKWTSPDSVSVFKRKRYKPTSSPCTWMNTYLLQKSLHLCIFFSCHTNLHLEFEVQGIPSPRPI